MLGDLPLDDLGHAILGVCEHYRAAWERVPTHAEWEGLLFLSMKSREEVEDGR